MECRDCIQLGAELATRPATRASVTFVMALFVVLNGHATAQERSGVMGGISIGGGNVSFSGSSADPALGIVRQDGDHGADIALRMYLGFSFTPRTSLLVDFGGATARTASVGGDVRLGSERVTFAESTVTQNSYVFAGAVQHWLTSTVWIRGGVGAGSLDSELLIEGSGLTITLAKGTALAVLGAAGVDVWRRRQFALDVQFHFTSFSLEGLHINSPTVQVGLTWH